MLLLNRFTPALLIFILLNIACSKVKSDDKKPDAPTFQENPVIKNLAPTFPGEVSGMADSYSRPGFLWLLQDGGNDAELLTLSHDGVEGPKLTLNNIDNQDWEDMAIADGPVQGKKYIYIADAGDNDLQHDGYYIYRFQEPEASVASINEIEKFSFQYQDKMHHDVDAMLVDPVSKDIILVTKEANARVFILKNPLSTSVINTAELAGTLNLASITGAAISSDGKEILLRSYSAMYYWKRKDGESVPAAMLTAPAEIPVAIEPQGEAVAFRKDNSGFFTLSENAGLPISLKLYYFQRN